METELKSKAAIFEHLMMQQQKSLSYYFENINLKELEAFHSELADCEGSLLFSGVGKSALIAKRFVHMLLSIGIQARFLSATDALHGELGVVEPSDIFIAVSKSGETEELIALLPHLKGRLLKCLSIVCYEGSQLELLSDLTLKVPLNKELCPFNLAPTTSSSLTMLVQDLLIVALMEKQNLSREVYAENHPAGLIGKRLNIRVEDLMLTKDEIPLINPERRLLDSLEIFTRKRCGCLVIVDNNQKLLGIFTDGDLRRTLQKSSVDLEHLTLSDVMIKEPKVAKSQELAYDALRKMQNTKDAYITELPVVDEKNQVVGLIRLHQIAQAGLCAQ